MAIVSIKKEDLIRFIVENCSSFGDPFMGLYVDKEGTINCVNKSDSGDSMPIFTFLGLGDYIDDNYRNPNDEKYNAEGVAKYIVEDGEILFFSGEILDDNGKKIKYDFEFI